MSATQSRFAKGRWLGLLLLCAGLTGMGAAHANGIGVKVGTTGIGAEFEWDAPLLPVNIRVGVNRYSDDFRFNVQDIDYDARLRLENAFAVVDLQLPLSALRLTVGVYTNANRMGLTARPSGTYEIGDETYTAAEAGTLRGSLGYPGLAPYVGIGSEISLFGIVGLNLEAGVLYQAAPRLTLTADGTLASDPDFQEDLERERVRMQRELGKYRLFPALSATFFIRF